jgi:hypothetical protein
MDKRSGLSVSALAVMIFFAFGSVDTDEMATAPTATNPASVDKKSTPAASASETGVAECDAYIKRYRCFLGKLGGDTSAADQMVQGYMTGLSAGPSDQTRKIIADSCTQAMTMMSDQLDKQGC